MNDRDMNDRDLFSPVALGLLITSIVAIFALSVGLTTLGKGDETPFRPNAASPSAIGHKGFYALLERLNLPVARSRLKGRIATGPGGLLIVAEPERRLMSFASGSDLRVAPNVLLVLPKWWGWKDHFHDGWIRRVGMYAPVIPRGVLAVADRKAQIYRGKAPATWTQNTFGTAPALEGDVQLIANSVLKPLIADGDKILLGELKTPRQRIWVLADPDPLENHGIATPANARFALAVVDALRGGNGRIVFDETVHGAVAPERNPLHLLFKFPYVIVAVEVLASVGLLLLAATKRFGRAEDPPSAFAFGKAQLIDNIAALMDRAGHQASILRRYVSVKLAEAGRALHAPAGLDEPALAGWLDRIGRSRGIDMQASAILARTAEPGDRGARTTARLFGGARDIDRWSKDLLDGSEGRRDYR